MPVSWDPGRARSSHGGPIFRATLHAMRATGPSPEAFRHRIRPNSPPDFTSWPEKPASRARGGGVDRDGLYRLAWPKAADSGILHPRRPRSSSVGCRRRQSRCRSRAGGPSHMLGAPRRRRRPWSWRSSDGRSPAIRARGVCWRPSPALSGARGRAQGRGAAREGRGPRASARRGASGSGSGSRRPRGRCPWAGRQGLGDPGCRPRRQARGFGEALALIGGQVLPAAGVDELDAADQARHFARRSVYRGPSARPHLNVRELGIRRDRGLQGVRGGPWMRQYVDSVSGGRECGASARASG